MSFTHETIERMDRDELVTACKALVDQLDADDGSPELVSAVVSLSKVVTAFTIEFGEEGRCVCGNPRWGVVVDVSPDVGEYLLTSERLDVDTNHIHLTVERRSDHHNRGGN